MEKFSTREHCIYVSICEQKLYLFSIGKLVKEYRVSTSRAKPSCIENSLGTPLGLHKIDGKIGGGEDLDTVFVGRKNVGLIKDQPEAKLKDNLITSRILRLRGLEEGLNCGGTCDTFNRYVYIHGTNQEDKLGTPNSHGCVLLSRKDVAELFDIANDDTPVLISLD